MSRVYRGIFRAISLPYDGHGTGERLTGSFIVKEEAITVTPDKPVEEVLEKPVGPNWGLIGGIIAAIIIIGLAVFFVWRRRAAA